MTRSTGILQNSLFKHINKFPLLLPMILEKRIECFCALDERFVKILGKILDPLAYLRNFKDA